MSTSEGGDGVKAVELPKNENDSSPKQANNIGESTEASGAKNNRQRRRSNTKGENAASRNGSRNNSQSAPKTHATRKDWSERKSFSHGGKENPKVNKNDDHHRTRSTNSTNGKRDPRESTRTLSQVSNGDAYDYSDEYDLEEPFSDSEDESFRPKKPQKMNLTIARGRIRTLSGTVPLVGYSPHWGGPTMCLSCLQFFDLPDQIPKFADHLLKEHKIVVSEMHLIVDPKRYIEHWRQRFVKESIDQVFPRIEPSEGENYYGETDYYYLMSENVAEDRTLRQRLAMRRLEEALSCQQREREDTSFQLQCIFCRYNARGNRSKIIHHLYMIHHLNLGSPDNLVFVTEYIEHLKEKLHRNECIYCEKVFPDRNTLMDHMRKRNHREVNPKNHYYDKFYIINYLELGKRWLDVLAEDFEDTMPTFQDSDEEEEDQEWCEWQEDNLDADETRVVCLLCEHTDDNASTLLEHMKATHEFDVLKLFQEAKFTSYQRLRLINYIRKQNYHANCWVCSDENLENPLALSKHIQEHKPLKALPDSSIWDNEENLVPLFGNDHFLWQLESMLEEGEDFTDGDDEFEDATKKFKKLVIDSKKNTVEGVIAEDLPDLHEMTTAELDDLM
ncbi:unnamed protein product [Caenorhabditis bovis]|uniref:C2H2-type domain-containing protein n=1 Tax=Caenorhabditis bovis TaxID=2654633 RepID=A0A8S1E883_9PELO|nr:unnamed protein product [Caenorhabditis bovis]